MNNRIALLKMLEYFPITGLLTKWMIDLATSDNMTATSSIIRDSCMSLYLACMLWFLMSSQVLPKFGIFVVFLLLLIYVTSIAMNASYITLINSGHFDMTSDTFWVFAEIVILFKYMFLYVADQSLPETWLIGLLLIMLPHAWIVVTNFINIKVRPTDDVIQNIKQPD